MKTLITAQELDIITQKNKVMKLNEYQDSTYKVAQFLISICELQAREGLNFINLSSTIAKYKNQYHCIIDTDGKIIEFPSMESLISLLENLKYKVSYIPLSSSDEDSTSPEYVFLKIQW